MGSGGELGDEAPFNLNLALQGKGESSIQSCLVCFPCNLTTGATES